MKKTRFTESQILDVLRQVESGLKVDDVCRKAGTSSATYYNPKARYGGMERSDIKRMKELEAEHAKLKKMYADLSLENYAMKELLEKKL